MTTALRRRAPLVLILLAGTALRLFQLGADSLWYDETVSTYLAGSPLPELIRHTAGDIHPPLYYVLLRGWLVLTGYPTGHADPAGIGLEFASGFFSLFCGVLLIALAYALARRIAAQRVALIAAALVALSPYNVWYSQEVRMYTLGAALGAVVFYALLRALRVGHIPSGLKAQSRLQPTRRPTFWWLVYAVASVAGMYSLYYFAFLLIPLNLWALAVLWRKQTKDEGPTTDRRFTLHVARFVPLVVADLAIVVLYAPWLPIAFRQATNPPVPPWRTAPAFLNVIAESWQALGLGQSAPTWLWPVLVAMLGIYALGSVALWTADRRPRSAVSGLVIATFGPLALILVVSLATPLYHVRYLFTYSPAFYVVIAAGLGWLWTRRRWAGITATGCWLIAAGVTLRAFWFDPTYRADDHRAAVHYLESRWQPGDVLLVNAGYAYPPLYTYWSGSIASRTRLTQPLPAPRSDDALVIVTTGHIDGDPGLGWGDPRSDFFALPSDVARQQIAALFDTYSRVWQYRVYDTVNDPDGLLRSLLDEHGRMIDERIYPGDAFMRLQDFAPRQGAVWVADRPSYRYTAGLTVQPGPLTTTAAAGDILSGALTWRVDVQPAADIATSLRLVGPDDTTWAQPRDERPLGPLFQSSQWPAGQLQRQPYAVAIPEGTPPGRYTLALLVYDPTTGAPWPPQDDREQPVAVPTGLNLGTVEVIRPVPSPAPEAALARFGPLALIQATSPATTVSPGGSVPVDLLWQAAEAPDEPLVVVVQLLGQGDRMVANLEEEPLKGAYPTQQWTAGELVRDRHTLALPPDLLPGTYRLIVGVYRAADRTRLTMSRRWQGTSQYWVIKLVTVR